MGNGTKINKKKKWIKRVLITLVLVVGFIVFYWFMYQTRTRQIELKTFGEFRENVASDMVLPDLKSMSYDEESFNGGITKSNLTTEYYYITNYSSIGKSDDDITFTCFAPDEARLENFYEFHEKISEYKNKEVFLSECSYDKEDENEKSLEFACEYAFFDDKYLYSVRICYYYENNLESRKQETLDKGLVIAKKFIDNVGESHEKKN